MKQVSKQQKNTDTTDTLSKDSSVKAVDQKQSNGTEVAQNNSKLYDKEFEICAQATD